MRTGRAAPLPQPRKPSFGARLLVFSLPLPSLPSPNFPPPVSCTVESSSAWMRGVFHIHGKRDWAVLNQRTAPLPDGGTHDKRSFGLGAGTANRGSILGDHSAGVNCPSSFGRSPSLPSDWHENSRYPSFFPPKTLFSRRPFCFTTSICPSATCHTVCTRYSHLQLILDESWIITPIPQLNRKFTANACATSNISCS